MRGTLRRATSSRSRCRGRGPFRGDVLDLPADGLVLRARVDAQAVQVAQRQQHVQPRVVLVLARFRVTGARVRARQTEMRRGLRVRDAGRASRQGSSDATACVEGRGTWGGCGWGSTVTGRVVTWTIVVFITQHDDHFGQQVEGDDQVLQHADLVASGAQQGLEVKQETRVRQQCQQLLPVPNQQFVHAARERCDKRRKSLGENRVFT